MSSQIVIIHACVSRAKRKGGGRFDQKGMVWVDEGGGGKVDGSKHATL